MGDTTDQANWLERAEEVRELLYVTESGGVITAPASDRERRETVLGQRVATHEDVVRHVRKGYHVVPRPRLTPETRPPRPDHSGAHAWVIGSGPSLETQPLHLLDGRLTAGLNRCLRRAYGLPWLPPYMVIPDQRCVEWESAPLGDEPPRLQPFLETGGRLVTTDRVQVPWLEPHAASWWRIHVLGQPGWSWDLSRGVFANFTAALIAAQWLAWCGARVINLVGVDLRHASDGRTHVHGRVPQNVACDDRLFMSMRACFELACEALEGTGVELVNCSPVADLPFMRKRTLRGSVQAALRAEKEVACA